MSKQTKPCPQCGNEHWKGAILAVVEGRSQSVESKDIDAVPERVLEFLTSLGWKQIEPEEGGALATNGWQWDWWMDFRKGKKKFTASGSGYYGGFRFGPTDEP